MTTRERRLREKERKANEEKEREIIHKKMSDIQAILDKQSELIITTRREIKELKKLLTKEETTIPIFSLIG